MRFHFMRVNYWRQIQTQSSVLYSMTDRNLGSISLKHIEKGPVAPLEAWFSYFFSLQKGDFLYLLQHCLPFQFQLKWDENILLRAFAAFQWHHLELFSLFFGIEIWKAFNLHTCSTDNIEFQKYTFSCLHTQCNFCTFETMWRLMFLLP